MSVNAAKWRMRGKQDKRVRVYESRTAAMNDSVRKREGEQKKRDKG